MTATAPHHSDALDAQLVLRAQDGDRDAFTELFRRHAGPAWRLALAVGGSTEIAATAVAKGFTLTLVRLHRRTTTLAVPFRHLVTRASGEAAASASREAHSPAESPNDVADAFYMLPEKWRAALWLTVAEGGTAAQVAPIVGLSEEGTASLVDRASDGLRARLARSTPLGSHGLRDVSDARPKLRAIATPRPLTLEAAAVRQWDAWQQTVVKDKRHGLAAIIPLRPWVERAVSTAAALVFAAGVAIAINQSARSAHEAPMLASPSHRIEQAASIDHRAMLPITVNRAARHSVGAAAHHGSSTHGTAPAASNDSARTAAPSAPASAPGDAPTTTTTAPPQDPVADHSGDSSPSTGAGTTVAGTPVAVTAGADGVGVTVGDTTVGNTTPTTAPDSGVSVNVDPGNGIPPVTVTVPF